ncbi:aldose 1-epimerase family protein [Formosa haliotis]|uniref:aldose 1-epimerase family protein n=1 Tax=Formosa haliotis TaxID=1555194 RepID=UPI0008255F2B|nr:aldose 1-epimerase family protein [Formosa haliotis]
MYTLQNKSLKIAVNPVGAELSEISAVQNTNQFMWNANPDVWGSFAPNLFPVIGAIKNNSAIIDGEHYAVPRHGFVRHNTDIILEEQTESKLVFSLLYNTDLLKIYPFKFKFTIQFELIEYAVKVTHIVENLDDKPIYFSIGGHPAFKCPVFENETYTDYYLEFDTEENSESYALNTALGLITDRTFPVISEANTISLHYDLFTEDALVFKDLKSKKVALKSRKNGTILTVDFPDFPYLGIWAKPKADYVCIEPWLGVADHEHHNQDFKTKEGIIMLPTKQTFKAAYTIEIDPKHLV